MDPESKLLVVIDVGERTLAMAQHVVHQVVQVLALACPPLCLGDGRQVSLEDLSAAYRYTTAILDAVEILPTPFRPPRRAIG